MSFPAPLINKHQLAEILDKPVTFVEENCRKRKWPFKMVGREYRFAEDQVAQIVASFDVTPAAAPARKPRTARTKVSTTPAPSGVALPKADPSRSRRYRPAGAA